MACEGFDVLYLAVCCYYVLEGVRGIEEVSLLATWIDMDGIG